MALSVAASPLKKYQSLGVIEKIDAIKNPATIPSDIAWPSVPLAQGNALKPPNKNGTKIMKAINPQCFKRELIPPNDIIAEEASAAQVRISCFFVYMLKVQSTNDEGLPLSLATRR